MQTVNRFNLLTDFNFVNRFCNLLADCKFVNRFPVGLEQPVKTDSRVNLMAYLASLKLAKASLVRLWTFFRGYCRHHWLLRLGLGGADQNPLRNSIEALVGRVWGCHDMETDLEQRAMKNPP